MLGLQHAMPNATFSKQYFRQQSLMGNGSWAMGTTTF